MLHLLGLASVLLASALWLAGWTLAHEISFAIAGLLLTVAGVCEITVSTSRAIRFAWAPTVGKVLAFSLCVVLAAASLSFSKQIVHSLSRIDPKYLAEFTAILASLVLPLIYMTIAAALLAVFAIFQVLLVGLLAIGNSLFAQAKPFVEKRTRDRLSLFWYRIRNGKKPPAGTELRFEFLSQSEISLIVSPMAKMAVVVVLGGGLQMLIDGYPILRPSLARALVVLEYRTGGGCHNIDASLPVVYMDDGWASVARLTNTGYVFTTEKCEFDAPNLAVPK